MGRSDGEVMFWTRAWVELGSLDKDEFRLGSGRALWGSLYGKMGARTAPKDSCKIERMVHAKWKKSGKIVWAASVVDSSSASAADVASVEVTGVPEFRGPPVRPLSHVPNKINAPRLIFQLHNFKHS